MSKKTKTTSGSTNIASNFIKSSVVGIITFILLLLIFSAIILKVNISENFFWIFSILASSFSAFAGSLTSCVNIRHKGLLNGMFTVIILLVIEFIVFLCFNNANLAYRIYFMIPAMFIFGIIGAIIGSNIKKK